ncbi:hypothetical protein AALO_G00199080 [Alosa alosa]|uniref:Uncharacterized protein n=1 Tax=Alosa alosa TaxID=278164 RepID=A0AAV6G6S3_9TELE|nr:hypothetical protein AALO_G00199080 [Alosa alosa]
MWISNTATTAMMLPIAYAVLDELQKTEAEADDLELQRGQTNEGIQMDETKGITTEKGMSLCVCYSAPPPTLSSRDRWMNCIQAMVE